MTLLGVVDPSHKEHASDTMGRLPSWLPLNEALEASADPKWAPWTQVLLRSMFEEHQERGDSISTSSLISHCPRAEVIKRKADYVGDLPDMYVPWRGTMIHRTMELYAGPEDIAEARFFTTLGGIEFSCSPDLLTKDSLWDYKMTENPPMYNSPWRSHTEQVQVNAYIVRNFTEVVWNGGGEEDLPFDPRESPPKVLGLVYLSPKTPKVLKVEHTEDYFDIAKGKQVRGKQPLVWSNEGAEAFILPRLEAFQSALKSYPEWPEGLERLWGGEPGWACPGYPLCKFPSCIAKRYPERLVW